VRAVPFFLLGAFEMAEVTRVSATPAALELIGTLRRQHGELLFHQSGGCCDGSAPMCFPANEFMVGEQADVKLGDIGGVPFYMSRPQFEYWEHTHLIIDAVPGNGGMFSLERPSGLRFLTRSRLYTDDELKALPPLRPIGSTVG
jgi:uncharacterized protein (DUF779 family)